MKKNFVFEFDECFIYVEVDHPKYSDPLHRQHVTEDIRSLIDEKAYECSGDCKVSSFPWCSLAGHGQRIKFAFPQYDEIGTIYWEAVYKDASIVTFIHHDPSD